MVDFPSHTTLTTHPPHGVTEVTTNVSITAPGTKPERIVKMLGYTAVALLANRTAPGLGWHDDVFRAAGTVGILLWLAFAIHSILKDT